MSESEEATQVLGFLKWSDLVNSHAGEAALPYKNKKLEMDEHISRSSNSPIDEVDEERCDDDDDEGYDDECYEDEGYDDECDCEECCCDESYDDERYDDEESEREDGNRLPRFERKHLAFLEWTCHEDADLRPHKRPRRSVAYNRCEQSKTVKNGQLNRESLLGLRFQRRFKLSRELFLKVTGAVLAHDHYFKQNVTSTGLDGITPLQKCLVSIALLANGFYRHLDTCTLDVKIAGSTALEWLIHYCETVVAVFRSDYLRTPTAEEQDNLLNLGAQRGFPGMLGCLGHTLFHYQPVRIGWDAMLNRRKRSTIYLQAVVDHRLWFWHAFFGVAGANRKSTVFSLSNLHDIGHYRPVELAGHRYSRGYYLSDDLCRESWMVISRIPDPDTEEKRHFVNEQEKVLKDVDKAFARLQTTWQLSNIFNQIYGSARLQPLVEASMILCNMMLEDEDENTQDITITTPSKRICPLKEETSLFQLCAYSIDLKNRKKHDQLLQDLVAHQWSLQGLTHPDQQNQVQ